MKAATLILANGAQLVYQLEHRPRRTIGLKITEAGLVVHAPLRISAGELNRVLAEKSHWILSKLESRRSRTPPAMVWQNGAQLLLLGKPIFLEVEHSLTRKKPELVQDTLVIYTAPQANQDAAFEASLAKAAMQWLIEQAREDFSRRLQVLAAKLVSKTPPLGLSNARSRWGSCSSRGDIRLNWRLIQAPPHIINYVICHELAHLKHMNHSAQFWAQVGALYPDYKQAEKELKALSPQLHRI